MVIGKGRRKKEGEGFSHGLTSFFFDSQNRMNESMHACLPVWWHWWNLLRTKTRLIKIS